MKSITSDHDLLALAKILRIDINEIYTIEELGSALPESGSFIILMRPDSGIGHWTCVHEDSYFDPFGNPPPKALGNIKYSDRQYQGTYSEFCGIWCLLWLYCKQKNKMHLLDQFSDLDIDVL